MNIRNLFFGQDYESMNWEELTDEARKRGLDPRLTSIKFMEGAAERDIQKIIEQLTIRDQARSNKVAFIISMIALIVSILSLIKK